jgi:hypothetical protein
MFKSDLFYVIILTTVFSSINKKELLLCVLVMAFLSVCMQDQFLALSLHSFET